MKKRTFLILFLCLATLSISVQAQRHHGDCPKPEPRPEVTELVSDLSSAQKNKLEKLTNESRERVDRLRKQQNQVRDSIGKLMESDGDQSKALFPLFDREAKLQTEISREMYTTKVRIEQVLTPDQRKEFRESNRRHHQQAKKSKRLKDERSK
jgi:Spy/CpxP family protein refolding chaperone